MVTIAPKQPPKPSTPSAGPAPTPAKTEPKKVEVKGYSGTDTVEIKGKPKAEKMPTTGELKAAQKELDDIEKSLKTKEQKKISTDLKSGQKELDEIKAKMADPFKGSKPPAATKFDNSADKQLDEIAKRPPDLGPTLRSFR